MLRTARFNFRRVARNTAPVRLDARAGIQLYAPAAYLRGASRQALRRERALTLFPGRLLPNSRRRASRLDMRVRNTVNARVSRYGVFALPAAVSSLMISTVFHGERPRRRVVGETARKK